MTRESPAQTPRVPHPDTPNSSLGGFTVTDQPVWDEALRRLLARRCVPARGTGRTLVGRERKVVPVAAPRGAA
jgi:hypothetical protein